MLIAMALVAACGGDEGFVVDPGSTNIGGGLNPQANAISVIASSPSLPSDSTQTVTVSVIVRDANNVAVEGVTVVLSTDSGILTVADPVSDASGVVTGTLAGGGDPTNRTITVSADANGVIGNVAINVIGTTLTISGPPALAQGFTAPYTVVLQDASGSGIAGQDVAISSSAGNTLSATSLVTDVGGQVQFDLTAAVAGADTISATALGLTATTDLSVSDDSFSFTAPLSAAEIVLNTATPVTLAWSIGGTPQAGQLISFSATRGTLTPSSATTDAAGNATVSIQSTNAGPSVITATNAAGTSTGVQVEFIADTPAVIDVQASPFTIGPAEQSTITAIVRDAQNNLVKNQVVTFDLDDVTGGQLSVASAQTDSQGRATTFYTASSTTSANNGVTITATVQGTAISGAVSLTVAQRELFISIGTGNSIFEPNTAQYRKEFIVQVTDSQGNGVEGVTVQVGVLSNYYHKGIWIYNGTNWVATVSTPAPGCIDEDFNRNGVLDLADGEDINGNGRIEAGNVATAVAQGGTGGTFISDSGGFGIVDVLYPQDHSMWVDVTLEATTTVQGTESKKASTFRLPVSADDTDDENETPPGVLLNGFIGSPYGQNAICTDTN